MEVGILINSSFGGFRLSEKAVSEYKAKTGKICSARRPDRLDPDLIEIIKELDQSDSSIKVEYMPKFYADNECYTIDEYDGKEMLVLDHHKASIINLLDRKDLRIRALEKLLKVKEEEITFLKNQ